MGYNYCCVGNGNYGSSYGYAVGNSGVGTAIIAIAILILVALGVIF
ncbi:MAG: hypothetical protein WCR27_03425 [Eubacteriales bacterium]